MSPLIIPVKKLDPEAHLPSYAHPGDAGMDIYALERTVVPAGKSAKIRTGLSFEIPDGYVGLCWDKSGLSINQSLKSLGGVLDAGYRGELMIGIFNLGSEDYVFEKHHKIIQMLIQPIVQGNIVEVTEMSDSSRGTGGLGSTGK